MPEFAFGALYPFVECPNPRFNGGMFIIGYLFDNDDPSFSVFKLQPSWSIHVPGPRWSDAVRAAGALDMSTFDHHMWSTDMYSRCEMTVIVYYESSYTKCSQRYFCSP